VTNQPFATVATRRPIYVTATISAAIIALYAWLGIEPAPFVELTASFAPVVSAILWLGRDARRSVLPLAYDWGLLSLVFWPAVFPWYAWRTRGRRGWRLALELYLLVLGPGLLATVVATIRWGLPG